MADKTDGDGCCADSDYESTDGLLDRNGYETRKCCNCGDVAEFQVYDPNECGLTAEDLIGGRS